MKQNVINLKNAANVAFVATQNHTSIPIVSAAICSKESTGIYETISELNTDTLEYNENQLKQILSTPLNIVVDSEETKTLIINHLNLKQYNIIPIFQLAHEILPKYIFRMVKLECVRDLYRIFFIDDFYEYDKIKEMRDMMVHTVNDLLCYDYYREDFPMVHKSSIIEKLLNKIDNVKDFAIVNIDKCYMSDEYNEISFCGASFIDNDDESDWCIRSHFDDEALFFEELSRLLERVPYVICYNSEIINRLKNLYAKFNKSYTFEIINLKSIADTILSENIQSCEELYLRFLCGYDYDYYFEYSDQTCQLYTILNLMIEEYKEVKDSLVD